MKSIDAGQTALLASPFLAEVVLVKLTTYTDRESATVDAVRYISDATRLYKYGAGAVREFQAWMISFDDQRDTMNHLPASDGRGLESTLRRVRKLRLRNRLPEDGSYLYQILRAEALEFASVEVSTLALAVPGQDWRDLSALAGTEATVTYRGRVSQVLSVTDAELILELESELPTLARVYATDPTKNDPNDVGFAAPIAFGRAKKIRAMGWDVGALTTLAASASAGATTLELTDASGFPSSAFGGARVGALLITWTGKTSNQLTGVSGLLRSQSVGQTVVEVVTTATWIVSSEPVSAIGDVYLEDPYTGAIVRVTSGLTKTLADPAAVPGRTVATVTLSTDELATLLDSLSPISQQAGGVELPSETMRATGDDGAIGGPGNHSRDGNLESGEDNLTWVLFSWTPVPGRVLVDVTYEAFATLNAGDSLAFRWPTTTSGNVQLVPNTSGITQSGWWRWTTSVPDYMGDTMAIEARVLHQVQRVERYTSGPTRVSDTRIPSSQVTSSHASWDRLVDGNVTSGFATTAELGFRWDAVPDRVLVEVVYRAYLTLQSADSWRVRATSGGADVFQSVNEIGVDVTGWFEYATTVPAEMGTDIYFVITTGSTYWEVERIEIYEGEDADVEIKSAKVGLGLTLYADVDGPVNPSDYAAGYGFDEDSGWTTAAGTRTTDGVIFTEGAGSQKLIAAPTLITDCNNDEANWTDVNCFAHDEGSYGGSLLIDPDNSSECYTTRTIASTNFTGKKLRLNLTPWAIYGGKLGATDGIRVEIRSSASNYRRWNLGLDELAMNVATTVTLDPTVSDSSAGSITAITGIRVYVNAAAPRSGSNIVTVDEIYLDEAPIAQKNATTGTVDLVATANAYKLDVRADGMSAGDVLRVYFSNVAGSGTAKPSSYWYFDVAAAELLSGSFVEVEKIATGVGSPASPTDVETLGFELIGTRLGTIWIDNLRKRLGTSSAGYAAAPGALLESMPDVIHWTLAELGGLGHGAIDASFAAAAGATYLDDNIHGGNLTILGATDADILAALAFEGRANLIADERAAGTVYRLLVARATYAWDAATITLDRFEKIDEEGRNGATVSTRFRHAFDLDSTAGLGLEAFRDVIETTVSAAETQFGRRDAPTFTLATVSESATATELAGYFAQELARIASVYNVAGLPWSDAFAIERGDVVELVVAWESSAIKARVIETTRRADGMVDLKAVGVS